MLFLEDPNPVIGVMIEMRRIRTSHHYSLSYLSQFLFVVFTALIFAHSTHQSCSCFPEFLINNAVDLI